MIWIATANGLNRFDGSSFKLMFPSRNDSVLDGNSLSSNNIKSLLTDQKGNIWVGTQGGGLNIIDPNTNLIRYIQHNPDDPYSLAHNEVLSLAEDQQGNIYVGTELGLSIIPSDSDRIFSFVENKDDTTTLYGRAVLKIHISAKNEIHLTTWGGPVHRFYPGKNGDWEASSFARLWHKDYITNTPHDMAVWGCLKDSHGLLWGGTFGSAVIVKAPESKKWQFMGPEEFPKLDQQIFDIEEDDQGRIWIGSSNGLNILSWEEGTDNRQSVDISKASLRSFFNQAAASNDIPSNQIRDIFFASNGIVWFATEGGLGKYDPKISNFVSFLGEDMQLTTSGIRALCKDHRGYIWLSNNVGDLFCVAENDGKKVKIKFEEENPDLRISFLFPYGKQLLVGTWYGLFRFDPVSFKSEFISIPHPSLDIQPNIRSIKQGADGLLWLSTLHGIISLDPQTEKYQYYAPELEPPYFIPDQNINDLILGDDGIIWAVAEDSGLIKLHFRDEQTMDTEVFLPVPENKASLINRNFRSIVRDEQYLWLGGVSGLFRFDLQHQSFTRYAEEYGLPSSYQDLLAIDKDGYIWGGTNVGISCFDPKKERFYVFNRTNAIPSKSFYDGVHFTDEAGNFFYAGDNGFIRFYPSEMRQHSPLPNLYMDGIQIDNIPIGVNETGPGTNEIILTQKLNRQREITLSYKHNILKIDFSVINFQFPKESRLQYRLVGL
ncbi:MAG: two-component regulator propeller domain-containing protein, partial [Bacteroidota bacterium]